ncbi:hypothetical protein ACRS6B_27190 [Nocardia asteroides]
MFAVRGFAAGLIGAATLTGAGAAAAAPLPLEPQAPAPAVSVAGSCGGITDPFVALVCAISSLFERRWHGRSMSGRRVGSAE